ncbi:GTPase Era [Desulfovibrio subterraneus]|jgi:GTP-binding protein Era|uniref:GTPase Era n=1 Tax=Desulfovibrio subterraneus TaxID=2718620 RepID=A0A7J0BFH1_9BACT|nr:GTPase Era [Desulfovibrio subterraneus]WBF66744.1 GTPase Era [Desulfovibrio subterraneus]GFM32457.1 GTPase Era [Desulfovibrio subterraneus]
MNETEHRCGWVAMMGPPNAGKSTMLNAFLGQKVAIVTPKPQTTRHQISGILSRPDAQIIFMDTPGIHQLRGKMNKILLQTAWQAMSGADVIMVVLDSDLYIRKPEFFENDIEPLSEAILNETRPVVVAVNKVDLFRDKSKMLPFLERLSKLWPNAEVFPVSAKNADGLTKILDHIKARLPVSPALYPADQLSTMPMRFMAAEVVREKLFLDLRQELPYYTAVEIEKWEDTGDRIIVNAIIYVARKTHKAMVIGKGGLTLKSVGTAARKELQEMTGKKVHLELWVKIREGWTEDIGFLRMLGMSS